MHEAADGGLARVRLPGGVLSTAQLGELSAAAVELGDGNLELTSRANIQIRALRPGAPRALSDRLYAAGLLPSITHERVRNILASPMSGLDQHSLYDVLPAVAELDGLLCARPELAELPGRFLFALDDGRGDLTAMKPDVGMRMVPGEPVQGELLLAGVSTGIRVPVEELAAVMLGAAEGFLAEREAQDSQAWRLAELTDGPTKVLKRLGMLDDARLESVEKIEPGLAAGRHQRLDGSTALVVTVPLGSLDPAQSEALRKAATGPLRVTPWRSIVLAEITEAAVERLEAAGLVLAADSPWNGITACAGRPGCAKALADVRGDARRLVPQLPAGRRRVHWSGCERRCGKPPGEYADVVAQDNGYTVNGKPRSKDADLIKAVLEDDEVMGMP